MYEVSLRIFYVQLLFFGTKIPMLSASFIDGSPYLFYAKHICHLYSLLTPIKAIVNSILSGWAAHITIFLTITVARIHLINVKFWQDQEQQKSKKDQRDMAFFFAY